MERTIISKAVSICFLKEWLYIDGAELDFKLKICLDAAINSAETFTGLTLSPSEYRGVLPFASKIALEIHPITSIKSVKIDGVELTPDQFSIDGDCICFAEGVFGKELELCVEAGVQPCPGDVTAAILMIAADMFQHPVDAVRQLPTTSAMLLGPHRYMHV